MTNLSEFVSDFISTTEGPVDAETIADAYLDQNPDAGETEEQCQQLVKDIRYYLA